MYLTPFERFKMISSFLEMTSRYHLLCVKFYWTIIVEVYFVIVGYSSQKRIVWQGNKWNRCKTSVDRILKQGLVTFVKPLF